MDTLLKTFFVSGGLILTQTSCRWKASLLINVGRINLLQNYYSAEIKTSCNLSAWFERFEEQLWCNEAVPPSFAHTPTTTFHPQPPFHLSVSPKRFSVFGTKLQLILESFWWIVFHIFNKRFLKINVSCFHSNKLKFN